MTGWVNFPWPTGAPAVCDHWVYKAYDADDQLLYVGVTATGRRRLHVHRRHSEWAARAMTIRIEHFGTRQEALRRERQLIREARPEFNVIYNAGGVPLATTTEDAAGEQVDSGAEAIAELVCLLEETYPDHPSIGGIVERLAALTERSESMATPPLDEPEEKWPQWLDEGEITVAMAAEAVCCSTRTIRRAIASGELPARLHVGRWAIHEESLRAWVERHRVVPKRRVTA